MIGLNLAEIVAMTYAPFLVQVIKFKIYKIELFNLNITDCPMIFLGSPVKAFFFLKKNSALVYLFGCTFKFQPL